MPTLLAIESSTSACSAALLKEGVLTEKFVVQARQHNQILLQMVTDLLGEGGIDLKKVDAIAFGAGPGSFTGLRLCVGVAQGLAYSVRKPVIPVSSLEAMALSFYQQELLSGEQTLLMAEDARMGDVYFAAYKVNKEQVVVLEQDALIPAVSLVERQRHYPEAVYVGSMWPNPVQVYPQASAVLKLALPDWKAGLIQNALEAKPVYLRDSVSWKKWQPKRPG